MGQTGFHGEGIGRALFHRALRRGRSPGAKILEVEFDPHAPGFYEKMGMHQGIKPASVSRMWMISAHCRSWR
jgi:GNAT superfamily N-acetyltransferase